MENLERKTIFAYLAVVFVVGLFFVFNNTPLTGLDERFHFFRALQVSQGELLSKEVDGKKNSWGGELDGKMMEYVRPYIDNQDRRLPTSKSISREHADQVDSMGDVARWNMSFPSTGSYSPVMYLPSSLGIKISGMAGLGVEEKLFSGRIFNLIFYIALLAWLYRVMPFLKALSVLVFTFPTMINLASSYSADPVTNLITAIFIAYCLRYAYAEGDFKIPVFVLGALTGLMKVTNVLFLPLIFIINKDKFPSRKAYITFCASVVMAGLICAVAWNHAFPFVPSEYWGTGASAHDAISYILSNPLVAISRILENAYSQFPAQMVYMFADFGGGPFPFNWVFSGYYVAIFFFISLIMILNHKQEKSILVRRFDIPLVSMILIASYLIIFLAFFIGFSPLSSGVITGVQGRYFNLCVFFFIILAYLFALRLGIALENNKHYKKINLALTISYLLMICMIASRSIHNYHQIYN